MRLIKNCKKSVKRVGTLFVVLTTILWSLGIPFGLTPKTAGAAATLSVTATPWGLTEVTKVALDAQNVVPIAFFGLDGGTGSESLNSVQITITNVNGVASSDFIACVVIADTGSGTEDTISDVQDNLFLGGNDNATNDDIILGTTSCNVGSATSLGSGNTPSSSLVIPSSISGSFNYIVAIVIDDIAISANDAFSASIDSITVDGSDILGGAVAVPTFTVRSSLTDTTNPSATANGGPPDGQIGAPVDALVDREFSEALAAGTVNTTNVKLQANAGNVQGGDPSSSPNLCGSVTFDTSTNRLVCDHLQDSTPLDPDTWYTFTITTGVTDGSGNALASNFTSQFQTGSFGGGTEFNPPPFVMATVPQSGATHPKNAKLKVKFNRDMDTTSTTSSNNVQLFATDQFGGPTGSNLLSDQLLSLSGDELTIDSTTLLTADTRYVLIVKGGSSGCTQCVQSTDSIPFPGPDYFLDFTAAADDSTAPTVSGSFPSDNDTGIDRAIYDISVGFSEALDPSTVTSTNVKLYKDDGTTNGSVDLSDTEVATATVDYDDAERTIVISPNAILDASKQYLIQLKTGLKDLAGNPLSANATIKFTTGANSDTTKPTLVFANADNFGLAITLSEPVKFDSTSNDNRTSSSGANDVNSLDNWTVYSCDSSLDCNVSSNFVQANLTGKGVEYLPNEKTLMIDGLALPPNAIFKVVASTNIQDLSGNAMDSSGTPAANELKGTVKNSTDTYGNLGPGASGPVDYFDMGETPIMVMPLTPMDGATTRYHVEFPTNTALPAGGTIVLTFPSGFSFDTANADTTKRCTTFPTDTFENEDLNGPAAGTVAVSSIACDSNTKTVTITLDSAGSNTGTQAGDMVRFEFQGVVNSSIPKDYTTSGYNVDIKTKDTTGTVLDSQTSMPFFINEAGSKTLSGKVFADNGAGGGTANNGTQDGGETGVQDIKVCLGGPAIGFQCKTTDSNGDYSFTQLNDGPYSLNLPPISSGSYTGGPFFRDVNISGSGPFTENFPLQQASAAFTLDVYVSGTGLSGTKLDVFAFSSETDIAVGPGGPAPGGFVVRECTLGTDCNNIQLPLSQGKWQVGVGPWMPKDPGSPPAPPDFTFMPPKPVEVDVSSAGVPSLSCGPSSDKDLCFTLSSTNRHIKGKVVDGSGNGIANTFVMARPAFFNEGDMGMAGVAQTDSNGNFTIKTLNGTYLVDASMPGMPPSNEIECTVKDNTITTDNNNDSTYGADVYCEGTLIKNDVAGFSASALTASATDNDLVIVIDKGDTSISGRILDDSGNPISFAHVQGQEIDSNGNPIGGWADAPTDNSGNYTLYVQGGSSGTPKKWKIQSFAPGFGELPSLTVSVTNGQNLTSKNLQASTSDFGTITGTVTQNGTAAQGVFVGIHGPCGGNGTVTDSSGNYTLKVRANASGSCTDPYTIDGFVPSQGPTSTIGSVTVTAGSTLSGQDLTVAQAGTLDVYICTLTDPNSSPGASNGCASGQISDAFVNAGDSSGKGNGTGSNPTSGQYELLLPAGTYTVKANNPKYGEIGSQSSVTVTGGQTTYINFTPPTLRTVTASITSNDSECLDGAAIMFSDQTNSRVAVAQATSGSVSVGLPDGTYSVNAIKPGCIDDSSPENFTLSASNTSPAARTLTLATSVITGQVYIDANSNSTADSGENIDFNGMVVATSSDNLAVVGEIDTSKSSGADNNYTLYVTPGTWNVSAHADGYESASVSVTAASTVTQDLELTGISGYTRQEAKPYSIKPSRGGIVRNDDIGSDFEVNFPAGALGTSSNDGSVSTKETTSVVDTPTQDVVGNKGYEITPKDANGQPIKTISSSSGSGVTITIPYSDSDASAAGGEDKLVLASWDATKQSWDPLSTTCDTANNTCTASTTHFSTFAAIVPQNPVQVASSGGGMDVTAPAAVSASSISTDGSSVTLNWTDPGDSDLNHIAILRNNGGGTAVTNSVYATVNKGAGTYTDSSVASGETYKYIIRAVDNNSNYTDTAELSITVTAPAAPAPTSGGGGGGGGGAAPAPTTPVETTPTEEAAPVTAAPVFTPEEQITKIHNEAATVVLGKVADVLTEIKAKRSTAKELKAIAVIKSLLGGQLPAKAVVQYALTNFIAYGTETTQILGSGERAGVVNSFKAAFGKMPENDTDWEDAIKIANGRWPSQRSTEAESRAKDTFKNIYLRDANMEDPHDNAAVTVMAYGLRPSNRNLDSEKAAIRIFKGIFKRNPVSADDWDAVRAIAYSGATR